MKTVYVAGPFRGGTSAVAGAISALGVPMGKDRFRPNRINRKGFFECVEFSRACLAAVDEPRAVVRLSDSAVDRLLRESFSRRLARSVRIGSGFMGAKHPSFCHLIPHINRVDPTALFVRVVRNVEDSVASMQRLSWRGWSSVDMRDSLQAMIDARDKALAEINPDRVLTVKVAEDPLVNAIKIDMFLGTDADEAHINAATKMLTK